MVGWNPGSALAQDTIPYPSAKDLTVSVNAVVLFQNGASVKLGYSVESDSSSQQQLWTLAIRAYLALSGSYELHGPSGWYGHTAIADDSNAVEWFARSAESRVDPGEALSGFTAQATGLLDIVPFAATGYYDLPDMPDDDTVVLGEAPPGWSNAATGLTVGHVPLEGEAVLSDLTTRLSGLIGRACNELGWIASSSLCTTLDSLLVSGPVRLDEFNDSLMANRTGGVYLADNPYTLLKGNRDYLRSLITSSKFALAYVCGSTLTARNKSQVIMPVTWTVDGTSEVGALILPAKPSNGPYSETTFDVTNQGHVRLHYEGAEEVAGLTPDYHACE